MRRALAVVGGLLVPAVAYLAAWPVPVEPVSWEAPSNPGYTGAFEENHRLEAVSILDIGSAHGPESVAVDAEGRIYAATDGGSILRLEADGSSPREFASTGGRPLGIQFSPTGELIVADGHRGLVAVSPAGKVTLLTDSVEGTPIVYADDVDVASTGVCYFSDASTRFAAKQWGTYEASVLEMVEHGGSGRLLAYDPATRETRVVATGFSFANGVALGEDEQWVLLSETGAYRVWRVWVAGPRAGQKEVLVDGLPGFPDNIRRGREGRFWVALVSPRNAMLDGASGSPGLRKAMQRLPSFVRPRATAYGHVIAIDGSGKVVANLQDPAGRYPLITSALETERFLYLGSLTAPGLARLEVARALAP